VAALSAPLSLIPAALFVGDDDDDDKHPPRRQSLLSSPLFSTALLPLLLQNPSGKGRNLASVVVSH